MRFINPKSSLVDFLVEAIGNSNNFELLCNAQKIIIDIDDVCEIVIQALKRGMLVKNRKYC
jgi:hypothetical protein